MKVAIFAILTEEQFSYLQNLASEKGIDCQFVVEGDESLITISRPQTATPITGEMLTAVAAATGRSAVQVAVEASNLGVTTVEEALAHASVPYEIKRILEEYI